MSRNHSITAVVDDRGISKILGAKLADGGEGSVYAVTGRDDLVVKIYHPMILSDAARRARLEHKIREMVELDLGLPALAWPLLSLNMVGGGWCGYAMRHKPGLSLRALLGSPQQLARFCPAWNRQHLVRLCLDYLDTFEFLVSRRVLPVDFNPANLLVDTTNVRVHLIDCDGFLVSGKNGMHPCGAITPDMAAPEILRSGMASGVTAESLRFSVALVLFYILTLGNSPYRHRNGDDPVSNLLNGACALGRGATQALPSGAFHRIWSHFIFDVKELFLRSFRDGHSNPGVRPALTEWRTALLKYNHCLVAGHADASFLPGRTKSSVRRKTTTNLSHP